MAWHTIWAPSTSGVGSASSTPRGQVTGTETSASLSRRVRKTVLEPPRRLIWATCPSTHTAPSRSTQEAIACEIGAPAPMLGEVSNGM